MKSEIFDVLVIGAGPAGVLAALRAADLGARTALVTQDEFGGMAANDGTVPVRTLAFAARLMREARQYSNYGINISEPQLDYSRLMSRVRDVVSDVRDHSAFRQQINSAGVVLFENFGKAHFVNERTIESEQGLRLEAAKIIICTGGQSRKLSVPGFELTNTHSDAWGLKSVPKSILVLGGGATGTQVASIFNAFGSKIQMFQSRERILHTEDSDVSDYVANEYRKAGIIVHENFGEINSFEKTQDGVRMNYTKDGERKFAEAQLVVVAIGWVANVAEMKLDTVGVKLTSRGYLEVDKYMRTSVPNIFAAGDVTGRLMLVPQAIQDGYVAATNAVKGTTISIEDQAVSPIGSFTDPEYAQVGLSEADARQSYNVVVKVVHFNQTTRTIIDGNTSGFCKLIVDRLTRKILGCHVVGDRAVEMAQVISVAMAAGMPVDELANVPLSFPTYAGILTRVAGSITRELNTEYVTEKSEILNTEKKGKDNGLINPSWQNL